MIAVIKADKHTRVQSYDKRTGRPSISQRELFAKPRLYLSVDMGQDGYKGENAMEHILFDRYSAKDLAKYARENGFIAQAFTLAGLSPETKVVFSQKAGCSCGCSPALIVQDQPWNSTYDLRVTIGDPELIAKAALWRQGTRYIMAIKAGRAIIKNAHLSGLKKVALKQCATWWSDESYHTWKAA